MYQGYTQNPYGGRQNGQMSNPYMMMQQQTISGRQVSSREEALSVPMDFVAGFTVMPDMAHGKVYVKVLNQNTGAVDMLTFDRAQEEAQPQYVTVDQMEQMKQKMLEMMAELKGEKK